MSVGYVLWVLRPLTWWVFFHPFKAWWMRTRGASLVQSYEKERIFHYEKDSPIGRPYDSEPKQVSREEETLLREYYWTLRTYNPDYLRKLLVRVLLTTASEFLNNPDYTRIHAQIGYELNSQMVGDVWMATVLMNGKFYKIPARYLVHVQEEDSVFRRFRI